MDVAVTSSTHQPGAQILLTATLSDRGWPSTGGDIEVTATKPDASCTTFPLYDDGTHGDTQVNDGVYTNNFNQTSLEGSYKFFFNGQGINERGELVPRQDTRYVYLSAPPVDGGNDTGPCLPCWAIWLMFLLIIAIFIILIRCCYKQSKFFSRQ